MALSAGYKALLRDGVWASGDGAVRELPESVGINRADGYGPAYEQLQSGKVVERAVFQELLHEITAALIDIAATGVPRWDAQADYQPPAGGASFVTTETGLWTTRTATGPSYGNAVSPDAPAQSIWRMY